MLRVNELIEQLQDLVETNEAAGAWEVRIAIQPQYPLQSHARSKIVAFDELGHEMEDEEDEEGGHDVDEANQDVVWIVEQAQVYAAPYAPAAIFDAGY